MIDQITVRITQICHALEFDQFTIQTRKTQLMDELSELIKMRDKLKEIFDEKEQMDRNQ